MKTMEKSQNPKQEIIAIVPSLGMGHVIPLIAFAKLLVSRYHFSVTLLLPTQAHQPDPAQLSLLEALPRSISYTFLPTQSNSSVGAELARARARVVALVTDLFGSDLFDLGKELNVPTYLYFTSTAMCLLFAFHLPKLDETVSCEYRDMAHPLVLPGCVPLHGKDFVDAAQDRSSQGYKIMIHHMKRFGLAHGIFINTFLNLEPNGIRALQTEDPNRPPIYPIGPIVRSGSGCDECLKWLDQQPFGSVLYVSFGSEGVLSNEQLNELAIGLEKSGFRFLWVIKRPNDEDNKLGFLPNGFINRTQDMGLLAPYWVPQIEILAHGSIGGSLTHCGWNSILESIINGVPLIAWPLYAEQKMNAVMLIEGLKIALRVKENESGMVKGDVIAKVIKELMEGGEEGKRVQNKMREIRDEAIKAISENGDSIKLLDQVALQWRN